MQKNPSLAALLIPDRIHPAEASQWVMAAALARDWGLSPVVSSAHIDASQPAPVATGNTQILRISRRTMARCDGSDLTPRSLSR